MCYALETPSKQGDVVVSADRTEDGHKMWPKHVGGYRRM
jgi:hypothetical protein